MSDATRTVICTLGMHRSGTSLVSRILNLLGVYLGAPHAVSGAGADNPKGYWEHHPLALLNDEILIHFGGRWDEPPVFPSGWTGDPGLADIRDRARRMVTEDFATRALWGWKDPRTCLTMPFWQELVGPMRYVVCARNPRAVAASLGRRNGIGVAQADRLWLTYVAASVTHTSGQPRLFVSYEDLMADWAPQLQRLAVFVGRAERAADPAVRTAVAEFIDDELYHHRPSAEDLAGDPGMSFATKGLYLALRVHAGTHFNPSQPGAHFADRSLDLLAAQAIEASQREDAMTVERSRLVAECDRLVTDRDAKSNALAALGAVRDDLTNQVAALTADRDWRAATAAALAAERDALTMQVTALGADVSAITADLKAAGQRLEEIQASSGWALVLFLRRLINRTMPVGTRRRRSFTALVRAITRRMRTGRRDRTLAESRTN